MVRWFDVGGRSSHGELELQEVSRDGYILMGCDLTYRGKADVDVLVCFCYGGRHTGLKKHCRS